MAVVSAVLVKDHGLGVGRLLLLDKDDGTPQRGSSADEPGHPGIGAPIAATILVDEAEAREGQVVLLEVPLEQLLVPREDLPREFVLA